MLPKGKTVLQLLESLASQPDGSVMLESVLPSQSDLQNDKTDSIALIPSTCRNTLKMLILPLLR